MRSTLWGILPHLILLLVSHRLLPLSCHITSFSPGCTHLRLQWFYYQQPRSTLVSIPLSMPYGLAYRSQTSVASKQWGNSHLGLIDETWEYNIHGWDVYIPSRVSQISTSSAIRTYISTEGTTDNDDVVPLLTTHKQASMEHEKVSIRMRTLKDTISLGTTHDYAVLEWKLKWELTTTS